MLKSVGLLVWTTSFICRQIMVQVSVLLTGMEWSKLISS